MQKELELVAEFHKKFSAPIAARPFLIPKDRFELRHKLMHDEVQEYLEGAQKGDLENIAKELADILYGVYGTILEHGLQDIMKEVFAEVHRSHMTKEYHQYKMVKGANFSKADLNKFF